jgi:hypothetical protein
MKTIEELFLEINESEELLKEINGLKNKTEFESFIRKHDCEATADEIIELIKSINDSSYEGELEDKDVEDVAGGRVQYAYNIKMSCSVKMAYLKKKTKAYDSISRFC